MSNYPVIIDDPSKGPITVTPLKTGQRADWHVAATEETAGLPVPFVETDITTQLRQFFDKLDIQAELHRDDPIAMVNALARMEALLADVRTVTATIRGYAAEALAEYRIRRMTIDGLATVEGTSSAERTNWQHTELLAQMMHHHFGAQLIDTASGVTYSPEEMTEIILEWFRIEWRLTPIRNAGLDPDDYSDLPTDEDGEPLRTPTIRIHDNALRKVI